MARMRDTEQPAVPLLWCWRLMSCYATSPADGPFSSCRYGGESNYESKTDEAPWALREVVKKSGCDPKDSALYSLRIGGTPTTVAGEKYQIE